MCRSNTEGHIVEKNQIYFNNTINIIQTPVSELSF